MVGVMAVSLWCGCVVGVVGACLGMVWVVFRVARCYDFGCWSVSWGWWWRNFFLDSLESFSFISFFIPFSLLFLCYFFSSLFLTFLSWRNRAFLDDLLVDTITVVFVMN